MDRHDEKPKADEPPQIDPITGQPLAVKKTKNRDAVLGSILFLVSLFVLYRALNARIERSGLTPLLWALWFGTFGGGLWFLISAIRQDRADRDKKASEKKNIPFNPR